MKLTGITKALLKVTGKPGLFVKKHSPEILLVVGIAGTVVSTVLACRATLKVEGVLDEHRELTDDIALATEQANTGVIPAEKYTENDRKKDLTTVYIQTGAKIAKLYAPAVLLGVVSVGCIVGGHGILKKRNVALVAAYKALEEGFNAYRQRVKEEYGEEKEHLIKNNLVAEQVTETSTDEKGKETKIKKTAYTHKGDNEPSIYARFFNETSNEWCKTPEYNLMFLKAQQQYFNQMLHVRGHVFLNEVYDALGIERSQAGTLVGWLANGKDSYIDFGIFDEDKPRAQAFVNGLEASILLDFNVDGIIYDLFTKETD